MKYFQQLLSVIWELKGSKVFLIPSAFVVLIIPVRYYLPDMLSFLPPESVFNAVVLVLFGVFLVVVSPYYLWKKDQLMIASLAKPEKKDIAKTLAFTKKGILREVATLLTLVEEFASKHRVLEASKLIDLEDKICKSEGKIRSLSNNLMHEQLIFESCREIVQLSGIIRDMVAHDENFYNELSDLRSNVKDLQIHIHS